MEELGHFVIIVGKDSPSGYTVEIAVIDQSTGLVLEHSPLVEILFHVTLVHNSNKQSNAKKPQRHPMLWMIEGATSTILVAAAPMIGAPSVTSPLPLRLLQRPETAKRHYK